MLSFKEIIVWPEEVFLFFVFKDFIYLFLERGEGREKQRKRNIDVCERYINVLPLTCPQLVT